MNIEMIVGAVTPKNFTSKAGKPCTTYSITNNTTGLEYKTGFDKPSCNPGDRVTFVSNAGQYGEEVVKYSLQVTEKNAESVSATPPTTSPPTSSGGGGRFVAKVFPMPQDHGDRSIVRQNSLMNARELLASVYTQKELKTMYESGTLSHMLMETAMTFEGFSTGDLYPNGIIDLMNEQQAAVEEAPSA